MRIGYQGEPNPSTLLQSDTAVIATADPEDIRLGRPLAQFGSASQPLLLSVPGKKEPG